jgi:hypothetical protein
LCGGSHRKLNTPEDNNQLFSITDEAATTKENESGFEDTDDEGEDIIKSINKLLDQGKASSIS